MKKILIGILVVGLLSLSGCVQQPAEPTETTIQETTDGETTVEETGLSAGLENPASKYCVDQGHKLEMRTQSDGGQYGVCIFPSEQECEEWEFYQGECSPDVLKNCMSSPICEDCGEIKDEEWEQGWYWGRCSQRRKFTPGDWYHIGEGTGSGRWVKPKSWDDINCECG